MIWKRGSIPEHLISSLNYYGTFILHVYNVNICDFSISIFSIGKFFIIKGSRMGHSVKVSLWCVALLINTRFRFFILE